jgi:hypothetical protein
MITTDVGRLVAWRRHSMGVTALLWRIMPASMLASTPRSF